MDALRDALRDAWEETGRGDSIANHSTDHTWIHIGFPRLILEVNAARRCSAPVRGLPPAVPQFRLGFGMSMLGMPQICG